METNQSIPDTENEPRLNNSHDVLNFLSTSIEANDSHWMDSQLTNKRKSTAKTRTADAKRKKTKM